MFKVQFLSRNLENYKPVTAGVAFGFLDLPLHFRVTSETVSGELSITFVARNDSSKKPITFEASEGADHSLQLAFFNPSRSGSSGLTAPTGLLSLGQDILAFMFSMEFVGNETSAYRLTYEFIHGKLEAPPSGGAK